MYLELENVNKAETLIDTIGGKTLTEAFVSPYISCDDQAFS